MHFRSTLPQLTFVNYYGETKKKSARINNIQNKLRKANEFTPNTGKKPKRMV